MLIAPLSYGSLSATSANTIKGNAPTFGGNFGNNRLGFEVGGEKYSEAIGNIESGVTKAFNAGLSLNDFHITSLTDDDYYDADGDEAQTPAFTIGSLNYQWIDNNGNELDKTDTTVMNQMLGCGGNLNLPLTLKISMADVQVHSKYGDPRDSGTVSLSKEYKIGTASGICFAQPNQLIRVPEVTWFGMNSSGQLTSLNDVNNTTPHPDNGGGYDSTQFDPTWGFKANANPKFPTTGFPKAKFRLIMTSNASDYKFISNSPAVIVDTNGNVTLNSKPTAPVTITAKLKADLNQVHTYTFDPRTVWVVPKLNSANAHNPSQEYTYTYTEAKSECGGESKIPTRAQLTNSPRKNATHHWNYVNNFYTRKIDGSVFGEWGLSNDSTIISPQISYPGSKWMYSTYWTRDVWVPGSHNYFITSAMGSVHGGGEIFSGHYNLACLG
ncbi:hypothetical protein RCS94_03010 [Orbaceae bacterium ac157xtp]